jgi:hypothetical protein
MATQTSNHVVPASFNEGQRSPLPGRIISAFCSPQFLRPQLVSHDVVNGDDPGEMAAYIRQTMTQKRLPAGRPGPHLLTM